MSADTTPAQMEPFTPPAPLPIRQALHPIDQHINNYLTRARLPTAT